MAHFNQRQGLFQSKGELAKYINDGEKEYIPYDYSYSEDIFPTINNLFPDVEKLEIKRPLKNIRVFLEGSLVGICFKGFDFNDIDSISLMMEATSSPDVDAVYFINCRFNTSCGIDLPSAGAGYYDCEFNEPFYVNIKGNELPDAPIEFHNCVFNSLLSLKNRNMLKLHT